MWQLYQTNDVGEWTLVETVSALSVAVRRIIELEDAPVDGLQLEAYVSAAPSSDRDALDHLEFTGKATAYAIKRLIQ